MSHPPHQPRSSQAFTGQVGSGDAGQAVTEAAIMEAWAKQAKRHKDFLDYSEKAAAKIIIGGNVAFNAKG
jgi:hypothetical protein